MSYLNSILSNIELPTKTVRRMLAKARFTTGQRLSLYRKIATFLDQGVAVNEIFLKLIKEYTRVEGRSARVVVLEDVHASIQRSLPVSKAMAPWAPGSECMLIKSGEDSSKLSLAFRSAVDSTTASSDMKSAVARALAYPVLLTIVLLVIVYLFGVEGIPKIALIKDPSEWTGSLKSLYTFSMFVQNYWLHSLVALAGGVILANRTLSRTTGKVRLFLDKLPPWNMYRSFQGAIFLISLSAMMRSGGAIFDSIKDLSIASNPYVRWKLRSILSKIQSGVLPGRAMSSGFLDVEAGIDVAIYQESGKLEDAMEQVGKDSVRYSLERIRIIAMIINVLALALLAAFIIWAYGSIISISDMTSL